MKKNGIELWSRKIFDSVGMKLSKWLLLVFFPRKRVDNRQCPETVATGD